MHTVADAHRDEMAASYSVGICWDNLHAKCRNKCPSTAYVSIDNKQYCTTLYSINTLEAAMSHTGNNSLAPLVNAIVTSDFMVSGASITGITYMELWCG